MLPMNRPDTRKCRLFGRQGKTGRTDPSGSLCRCYTSAVEPDDSAPPEPNASPSEDEPMLYCPVCAVRLVERKCKLFCPQCGYYMSCADYY